MKPHTEGAVLNVSAAELAREAVRKSIKSIMDTPESRQYQELLPDKLAKANEFLDNLRK